MSEPTTLPTEIAEGEVLEAGEMADPTALVPASALHPDHPYSLGEYRWMAAAISRATVTLPKALQGKPEDVLAVMLAGRELGLGPMESTRLIDIINGQTALRVRLKLKFAKRAGHDIRAKVRRPGYCQVFCADHPDAPPIAWAVNTTAARDDAEATIVPQSFLSKDNWKLYEGQMLFWRACGQMIAEHCPEVEGGTMYGSEELE